MKNHLKEIRKNAGLTLQQLADMFSSTKSHCWALENGKAMPTLPTAYAIAKALDKTVYEIWPDNTERLEGTLIIRQKDTA